MVALKAQLVEKQTVQTENHRLKLQLDSMEAQCRVEQRKAGEERSGTPQQRFNTPDSIKVSAAFDRCGLPSQEHPGPAEGCLHQALRGLQ